MWTIIEVDVKDWPVLKKKLEKEDGWDTRVKWDTGA